MEFAAMAQETSSAKENAIGLPLVRVIKAREESS